MSKPYELNANFTNKVILSASRTSNCLLLNTWDLKNRWSKSLYISQPALERWLYSDHTERFFDDDMDNIIRLYCSSDNEITVEILWLDSRCADELSGYRQSFYIPISFLMDAVQVDTGCSIKCLGDRRGHVAQAHIVISESANEQIRKMHPWQRNTLRKAMRHAFQWGRQSTVTLYGEWGMDFYFREANGICGGLCMSKTTIIGKDHKQHSKHTYTIHT